MKRTEGHRGIKRYFTVSETRRYEKRKEYSDNKNKMNIY